MNIQGSLFQARDKLIKGLAAAKVRAEEERKKERAEQWEKAMAEKKKNTEPSQSAKPPLPSQKAGTSMVQTSYS